MAEPPTYSPKDKPSIPARCGSLDIRQYCRFEIFIDRGQSVRLDIFRCALLIQVIFGHLAAIALPSIPEAIHIPELSWFVVPFRLVTRFGRESAFLFIYLSGFLVGGSLLRDALNGRQSNPRDFLKRRLLRIVPTLAAALVMTAVLDNLAVQLLDLRSIYAAYSAYDMISFATAWNFLGNLFCLQPTFVNVYGSDGPLWTLGYIVQFYAAGLLVFRYGVGASVRRQLWIIILVGCMGIISIEWLVLFFVWMIGALARNCKAPQWSANLMLLLFLTIVGVSNFLPPLGAAALTGICGPLATGWVSASKEDRLVAWLEFSVVRGARLSFAAYALHFPIAFFIFAIFLRQRSHNILVFLAFLLASLTATYFVSLVIWRHTEGLNPRSAPALAVGTP
jgi:peptidoglycan/LPS O-acetylase OafA/YrhL